MPNYDYVCKDCSERFEVRASVAEYSNGIKPHCPKCQSRNVIRGFADQHRGFASRDVRPLWLLWSRWRRRLLRSPNVTVNASDS